MIFIKAFISLMNFLEKCLYLALVFGLVIIFVDKCSQVQNEYQYKENKIRELFQITHKAKIKNIYYYKPWNIIKEYYGEDADKVRKLAFSYKKPNYKGIFLNEELIDKYFPVVFQNPDNFSHRSFLMGVCVYDNYSLLRKDTVCIIRYFSDKTTLVHELSHACQYSSEKKVYDIKNYWFDAYYKTNSDYYSYLLNEQEFGVRMAQMKREYYKLTGKIICDTDSAKVAIRHFLNNHEKYHVDLYRIREIIILSTLSKNEGEFINIVSEILPGLI